MNLFTYGTLRRGFHNNYLIAEARFLQEDSLKGTLYTNAPKGQGIPFLLPGVGTVRGELFDVPEALFHRLDMLEGHPDWYTREKRLLDSGLEAWVYCYNHIDRVEQLFLAPSGTYGEKRDKEV